MLSPEERDSYDEQLSFDIIGKMVRPVCAILTRQMKRCIDILIQTREKIGVRSSNPLLYARPHKPGTIFDDFYDGSKCIEFVKALCDPRSPVHFTENGLRHHAATNAHVLNKGEKFAEQMAEQMDHTYEVHKKNYRLPVAAIQSGIAIYCFKWLEAIANLPQLLQHETRWTMSMQKMIYHWKKMWLKTQAQLEQRKIQLPHTSQSEQSKQSKSLWSCKKSFIPSRWQLK